jgi:hypothetical protein
MYLYLNIHICIYIYIYIHIGVDHTQIISNDTTLNSLDDLDEFLNNLIDEDDIQTKKESTDSANIILKSKL